MQFEGLELEVVTNKGEFVSLADLGVQLQIDQSGPPEATRVGIERFAAFVLPVPAENPLSTDPEDQSTGGILIELADEGQEGVWNQLSGSLTFTANLKVRYWLLDEINPPQASVCMEESGSSGTENSENWVVVFEGQASIETDPDTGGERLRVQNVSVDLFQPAPSKGAIDRFFYWAGFQLWLMRQKTYPGLDACAAAKKKNKLSVCIQPVFIRFGNGANDTTGAGLADMKAKADAIWGKCCIEFEWKQPMIINKPQYKDLKEADEDALKDEVDPRRENGCIEVFFVARMVTDDTPPKPHRSGDGVAWLRSGKAIVADEAVTGCNPKADGVLAHELGHALGGCLHPKNQPGAAGTVMEPTGRDRPQCPGVNSAVVKTFQCLLARGSALAKEKNPKVPCCLDTP